MNITRHLYLSTALRAPEDGGSADPPADPPAPEVMASDPPAADPPAADPPAPTPAPAPPTIPMSVFQRRVNEETNKRQAFEQRATEAETKAANLQAIIDRLQAEQQRPPADPAAAPAPAPRAPAPPVQQPDIAEAVRREVDSREATRSIQDVIAKGTAEFTQAQWDEKAGILAALGAATPEFVQDVIAVDASNAHRIIFSLANDPAKAADLAGMNVRQRTAELTRMSMAEQAKNPPAAKVDPAPVPAAKTPVSKAPAPTSVPRTNSDAGSIDPTSPDDNAKMSDAQFEKWYKEKYYKRA